MNKNYKKLIEELKMEGASSQEAEELSLMSKNISNLYRFERSQETKYKFLEKKLNYSEKVLTHKRLFAALFLSILLLLGVGSEAVVKAQDSKPGELLYPIKKITQNVSSFLKTKTSEKSAKLEKPKEIILTPTPTPSKTDETNKKEEIKIIPISPVISPTVVPQTNGNVIQNTTNQTQGTVNNTVQNVTKPVENVVNNAQNTVNQTLDNTKNLLGL